MDRTRKTREQYHGINGKLKYNSFYLSSKKIICYILSLYVCCDISVHVSPEDI